MKMYDTTQPVENYLNKKFECECGLTHYAPIKAVRIGKDALSSLPDYVRDYGYKRPYIICDEITYRIAASKCNDLLINAGFRPSIHIIKNLGFDEATLGEIVVNEPDDCDLMIGVGTGSITDILRYASFKLKLPCFTVTTGAPMDGFSASVGIMNVNNLKTTMPAHSTEVIIGDTDILSGAPFRMVAAGFADLAAKLNAQNDWHLDVLLNNAHYCKKIDTMIMDYVYDIIRKADAIKRNEPEAVGALMNALLLTGASISLYGNSRPISGAEHHMSHYWDVLGEQRGKPFAMHGEQAGVGTVLALTFVEKIRNKKVDFNSAREKTSRYDKNKWISEIYRVYGNAADAVIELENNSGKNEIEGRIRRISVIESKWDEIVELLDTVFPSSELKSILKELGCPCSPKEICISSAVLRDTFIYCKETRARYTIYQLAWDLGIIESVADEIISELVLSGEV